MQTGGEAEFSNVPDGHGQEFPLINLCTVLPVALTHCVQELAFPEHSKHG